MFLFVGQARGKCGFFHCEILSYIKQGTSKPQGSLDGNSVGQPKPDTMHVTWGTAASARFAKCACVIGGGLISIVDSVGIVCSKSDTAMKTRASLTWLKSLIRLWCNYLVNCEFPARSFHVWSLSQGCVVPCPWLKQHLFLLVHECWSTLIVVGLARWGSNKILIIIF